jgi:hypothetical protein
MEGRFPFRILANPNNSPNTDRLRQFRQAGACVRHFGRQHQIGRLRYNGYGTGRKTRAILCERGYAR